jgi:1-acyl-sn-glycerol-3-phosphate acyltransferase
MIPTHGTHGQIPDPAQWIPVQQVAVKAAFPHTREWRLQAMIHARRYTPTSTRFFTWILRHTVGRFLKNRYRVTGLGTELFASLKPPFILVGNHTTIMDPFITNFFVPHPVHWIASDGNMRIPILRFLLLKLVGTIPKSKAIPDIETVNWIVTFIRKRTHVVGFYPEGQATWNGRSLPSFGSTAKLMKLLKVPVVLAMSRGAYMSKPRWTHNLRPGGMEIEFSVLFTPEQLKEMPVSGIDEALDAALKHDDPAWAHAAGRAYDSKARAEHLELALFACPSCGSLHTLKSKGNILTCMACGLSVEYGKEGRFAMKDRGAGQGSFLPDAGQGDGASFFSCIAEWEIWQRSHLRRLLEDIFMARPDCSIFEDAEVTLLSGSRMDSMKPLGKGRLSLSSSHLSFTTGHGDCTRFEPARIEGAGVLKWNHLEFYVGKTVYRLRFSDPKTSGYKYAVALELLTRPGTRELRASRNDASLPESGK